MQTTTKSEQTTVVSTKNQGVKLRQLKQQILIQNASMLRSEIKNLEMSRTKMESLLKNIQHQITQKTQASNQLKIQLQKLSHQIQNNDQKLRLQQKQSSILAKINQLKQQYVYTCKKRIVIAKTIDIKNLRKIQIQNRKSLANQIFRWIIVAIYDEPESKYMWDNFRKEVFVKDKGIDFIQKIGKSSTFNLKIEQKAKTEYLMSNYNQITQTPQLKPHKPQLQKLHKIIQNFEQAFKLATQIKTQDALLNQTLIHKQENEQEYDKLRARLNALQGRYDLNLRYIRQMTMLQNQLMLKVKIYGERIFQARVLLNQFQLFFKEDLGFGFDQFGSSKAECNCVLF